MAIPVVANKAQLFEGLWKNGPNSHLIYYLSNILWSQLIISCLIEYNMLLIL